MAYRTDFEETPVDAEFKQKVNVEYLVLKQIDRCNNAALEGDEIKFANAVESLLAMLPKENRLRIENDKTKESYISKIEQPIYKYSCGKPMGTLENPIFRNKKTDWNYDGGEPIRISPMVEEVEQTDYQKLYKIILNELQDVGVTWKIEPRGNVEKKIDPPPIPLLKLKDGSFVRVLIAKGIEGVKEGIVEDKEPKPPEPLSPPEPIEIPQLKVETDDDDDDEENDEKDIENEEQETSPDDEENEEYNKDIENELETEEDKEFSEFKNKLEIRKENKIKQKVDREKFNEETQQKLKETEAKNISMSEETTPIEETLPKINIPKITKRRRPIPRIDEKI
jgi:hypothetical protein